MILLYRGNPEFISLLSVRMNGFKISQLNGMLSWRKQFHKRISITQKKLCYDEYVYQIFILKTQLHSIYKIWTIEYINANGMPVKYNIYDLRNKARLPRGLASDYKQLNKWNISTLNQFRKYPKTSFRIFMETIAWRFQLIWGNDALN